MRMMQDSGGGKYNTPTAKGLDRIWKPRTRVKQFITDVAKSYYQASAEKPELRPDTQLLPDPVRCDAPHDHSAGPADDGHPRQPHADVEVLVVRQVEEPGVVGPGISG